MDCPHCQKKLTAVFRGLVVIDYVPRPVVDGGVDIDGIVTEVDPYWEEFEDGSHGVFYACPHCRSDLSDLFDEDGQRSGEGES